MQQLTLARQAEFQSSTKNEDKERDPAMHQTRKGNQWYFGMKAHIGVDSKEGTLLHPSGPSLHAQHSTATRKVSILIQSS